ncbi:Os04g0505066 [Oryza sativa Japonica Group]|uniref:Os04g0505066 protein n=1 Tax=Oryza sativa subsp. japonica TaxID=39947 RepID=A0A0P0WC15_ORYSJ|nr:hypothetical protein EE612_024273 [Oryza sativa]BAS89972.1 Os04g0505066 [Oryza sativa Japonica Group]
MSLLSKLPPCFFFFLFFISTETVVSGDLGITGRGAICVEPLLSTLWPVPTSCSCRRFFSVVTRSSFSFLHAASMDGGELKF